MKIFADTNVLASGFATRGLCADLIRKIMAEHELFLSEYVLLELQKTLRNKFKAPEPLIINAIDLLHRFSIITTPLNLAGLHVRDKNDIPILAAALACKAEVLVTGDRDLLILEKHGTLVMMNPRSLWELLLKQSDPSM